jgi:hypothetical protein
MYKDLENTWYEVPYWPSVWQYFGTDLLKVRGTTKIVTSSTLREVNRVGLECVYKEEVTASASFLDAASVSNKRGS